MPICATNPFKGRRHPGEVIVQAVRWYLRYPLAYEHVAELLAERGKRCVPHLKRTNKSYRIDETYIKMKGQDKYLYRADDSTGQTIDFLLSAKRDTAAAKRFFEKVFSSDANPIPRVINVDQNPRVSRGSECVKRLKVCSRTECAFVNANISTM